MPLSAGGSRPARHVIATATDRGLQAVSPRAGHRCPALAALCPSFLVLFQRLARRSHDFMTPQGERSICFWDSVWSVQSVFLGSSCSDAVLRCLAPCLLRARPPEDLDEVRDKVRDTAPQAGQRPPRSVAVTEGNGNVRDKTEPPQSAAYCFIGGAAGLDNLLILLMFNRHESLCSKRAII
jgi:hypothetical protein